MRVPLRGLRWLAVATTGGMFLVLVMGAAVTNTGSAEGCGRSWPLCNGQFVPEFTVATAIEYSHRAVTGVEGLLVMVLTAVMLRLWRKDREAVGLALLMFVTLLLQAGLGAGAVLAPQSPLMLATHFGVSLVAFASTLLSAAVVFERTRNRTSLPQRVAPTGFSALGTRRRPLRTGRRVPGSVRSPRRHQPGLRGLAALQRPGRTEFGWPDRRGLCPPVGRDRRRTAPGLAGMASPSGGYRAESSRGSSWPERAAGAERSPRGVVCARTVQHPGARWHYGAALCVPGVPGPPGA